MVCCQNPIMLSPSVPMEAPCMHRIVSRRSHATKCDAWFVHSRKHGAKGVNVMDIAIPVQGHLLGCLRNTRISHYQKSTTCALIMLATTGVHS